MKKTVVFFVALAVALSSCLIISIPGRNTAKAVGPFEWIQVNNGFASGHLGVSCFAVDPTSAQIVYAGMNEDGVYKTTDGGSLWVQMVSGLTDFHVRSVAIDPDHHLVVYAGTNTFLFKSTDGGILWNAMDNGLVNKDIRSLAIDLTDTQVVYAATNYGVYKSTTGGSLWVQKNSGLTTNDAYSLAIAPSNHQVVYLATSKGVYKSTNGGDLWTLTALTFAYANNSHTRSLAIDPTDAQVLYSGAESGWVYRSIDGGTSWAHSGVVPSSTPDINALVIDPANHQVVYAVAKSGSSATGGVYMSMDGAISWASAGLSHSYLDCLAMAPTDNQMIYAGTDYAGAFKSHVVSSYVLTTTASPTAGGSIIRSPGLSSYAPGTVVTLTANANPGYTFIGWSGNLGGTTNPGTVTMIGNKTVTATFAANASDHAMYITSPLEGATLTGSMVAVAGTFDTAHSGSFNLVVTIPGVGTHIYPFTVLTPATTWGPVSVLRTDFPDLVSGETYGLTLQAATDLPTIPPLQTGVRTVSWQVQDTVSYTLSLLPSWNVISVPFPTPVSLLPTCDLFLAWDGSLWQPVTTLFPGTGYLVRNTIGATTVPLTGLPSSSPQTQPATGTWQIIGNPYTTPVSFACTSAVPYLLFWDGSFWQSAPPTNLPPGLGFLLEASSPGTITLTRLP